VGKSTLSHGLQEPLTAIAAGAEMAQHHLKGKMAGHLSRTLFHSSPVSAYYR